MHFVVYMFISSAVTVFFVRGQISRRQCRLIGMKVCIMVELHPRSVFSSFGADIFWGHLMRGQETGSGGPFSASDAPIFAI